MKRDPFPTAALFPQRSGTVCHWKKLRLFQPLLFLAALCPLSATEMNTHLEVPRVGAHSLQILSPNVLELVLINTKAPGSAPVENWNWVNDQGALTPPDLQSFRAVIAGQTQTVSGVGFKRRPFYAPLKSWDLRIANHLYLRLDTPVSEGQTVEFIHDGTLGPTNLQFRAIADPLRYSPAIHVNQEGYLPTFPKIAAVGYYLGSLGELPVSTNRFLIVSDRDGTPVFEGTLTRRSDFGYTYAPTPYQEVFEANFSSLTTPGAYRVVVPGMGASLPFRIDEGIGMNFARTYALGLFHQRSGYDVAMPFTRFTHAADHLAPASVPSNASAPFEFTWNLVAQYGSEVHSDNPIQTAPLLTNAAAQLYPFVDLGPLDVSGGHFEAGDYNRVTFNCAQQIHVLMFAVDSIPGVSSLDNLGIPESGDGISDVLQEAKWEADFLAKMQDTDGGFYYAAYPQYREYESDVLPENGDPEVVWPKNTVATAASVAALAQCASSPLFKQAYPAAADHYWTKAQAGWRFLTNAIALHGPNGAYQKIQHFGDGYGDRDELAWAACEMFLASGDPQYQEFLQSRFPDPTDPESFRWGWWRMYVCFGNAIRSYATAATSGRLQADQMDSNYLARCINVITNCGNDNLLWSQQNAYGSSFPETTKAVRGAGWYFSPVQAFDLVVAQQFNPNSNYVDAIIRNLNYEAGCNPLNQPYLTGVGWKRQREIVDQYSNNDRRTLPKIGVPTSNLQEGFVWTWTYGWELSPLSFPSDGAETAPYPIYDRWCDLFNVTTEASTTDTVRSLAVAAWLAAQTGAAAQPWRSTAASIVTPTDPQLPGLPMTLTLQVADTNLAGARITWEARAQEPAFGGLSHTFTPAGEEGVHWVEAEVHWPDGRRAFATNSITVSSNTPGKLSSPETVAGGGFSFSLRGVPNARYRIEMSTNLTAWEAVATNQLPVSGMMQVNSSPSASAPSRFYRATRIQ